MKRGIFKPGAQRWLKPLLWTILGIWAVIVIVLQIALNSKVLTRIVDEAAKEYVDGDVSFSGIKASMFRSFPNLNVTIDNFSITYPHDRFAAFDSLDAPGGYLLGSGRGETADTLAHFRKLSVSINYLAAATGRIRIRHAMLDHPRIFAHQYDSTSANWNIFGDNSAKEDSDTTSSTLPPISIGKVSLGGRPFVVYTNPADTIFGCIFLKNLTAKGHYDARKGKIERVNLEMDSLFMAGRLPADTVALGIERLGIKERIGHFDVSLSSNLFLGLKSSGRMSIPVEIKGDIIPELDKKRVAVENLSRLLRERHSDKRVGGDGKGFRQRACRIFRKEFSCFEEIAHRCVAVRQRLLQWVLRQGHRKSSASFRTDSSAGFQTRLGGDRR